MPGIKEIAERAGVSIGTVDRVVHNRGRVSPMTEEKIRQAITDLGYVPNESARALVKNRVIHLHGLQPLPHQDSGYWGQTLAGVERAGQELRARSVMLETHFYDRRDRMSFDKTFAHVLDQKPDGLLLASTFEFEGEDWRRRAGGLPIYLYDADVPGLEAVGLAGQNSWQSGRVAARLIADMLPKGGDVLIFRFAGGNTTTRQRIKGFLDTLGEMGATELRHTLFDGGDESSAALARQLKQRVDAGLDAVFIPNANARVIVHLDLPPHIKIIGYDLVAENIEALRQGRLHYLIGQSPEAQGYWATRHLAEGLLSNSPVVQSFKAPIHIVNRENYNEILQSY